MTPIDIIVVIVLLAVGGALSVGGIVLFYRLWRLLRVGRCAVATIIRYEESQMSDQHHRWPVYHPVFVFQDERGNTFEVKSGLGLGHKPRREGAKAPILYDPDNPSNAAIRSFANLWLGPLLITLLGFGALAGGLTVWFLDLPITSRSTTR